MAERVGTRAEGQVGRKENRQLLEALIARSGLINRAIMHLYLRIDLLGLDRWYELIGRMRGRKRLANQISYWPLRVLERLSALYIGGSLTAGEQATFGRICHLRDYQLSRINALLFGLPAGIAFFISGKFTVWIGSFTGILSGGFDLMALAFYSVGAISLVVDLFRVVDGFARRRAHMPFGLSPLLLNSTTFLKHIAERVLGPDRARWF